MLWCLSERYGAKIRHEDILCKSHTMMKALRHCELTRFAKSSEMRLANSRADILPECLHHDIQTKSRDGDHIFTRNPSKHPLVCVERTGKA